MQNHKKIISITLVIMFAFSTFVPSLAQTNAVISQEDAIKKAKEIFDTSVYDSFNINYNERTDQKNWNLDWSMSGEPYGSLNVNVDAETGNIIYISRYQGYDPDKKLPLMPKFTEETALQLAEAFAKKLQPEEFSQTKYNKSQSYRPIEPLRYRENYNFNFTRISNNIPVEDNGFNITVNADTGEIEYYSFNWSNKPLPSAKDIISKEEAEKIFQDKIGLKLIYQRYFDYRLKKETIKLVYTLDGSSVLIDAINGKLLNNDYYMERAIMDKEASSNDGQGVFTPVEQKEVEATKNCITKDTAIAMVKKYINIPEDYVQQSANLYEDYFNPDQKAWRISWDKKSESNYGSIYARVNAIDSELLSFNFYEDDHQGDFKQKYDRTEAQKKAEEFIKRFQPDRFTEVRLEEIKEQPQNPEKERSHGFTFTRIVRDIPYIANGFNVTVDASSGQVTSYEMQWQDRNFPNADGVLTKNDAESRFLKDVGLDLAYVNIYDRKEDTSKYHIVYKLKPSKSLVFDAFELLPLDYQGKPIEEQHATAFTDIKGHWAENDIQLLVDLGIIKSTEDKYKPDENMTQGEFVKLLMIGNHHDIPETDRDDIQKYVNQAIKMGWIKSGEVKAKDPISREKIGVFIVRALGYEKVASLTNIFQVAVKDKDSISPEYKGHTAIALELGIINEEAGNFKPKANVSRAEAAAILVRMLKMEK